MYIVQYFPLDHNEESFWIICSYICTMLYCIAGKFVGEKVWRIDSFQAFGERKFGELIDQPIDY